MDVVEPLGDGVIVHGSVSGELATAPTGEAEILPPLPGARAEFTAKFDPSVRPTPGERLRVSVDPAKVHVFDSKTGNAKR